MEKINFYLKANMVRFFIQVKYTKKCVLNSAFKVILGNEREGEKKLNDKWIKNKWDTKR